MSSHASAGRQLKQQTMKTTTLLTIVIAGMFTVSSFAQNQQIPNGEFETWHTQGQGEDPDNWGSLFNQFNSPYVLISKTNDANSGTNALKLICDTGTVQPPLGSGSPGDTIYGSVFLGLANAQVGNAKVPFTSKPDSLTGYMKGTVVNGGLYMEMRLYKAGQSIGNAVYITVSSAAGYTRFSVPVIYSQGITPDTMTFSIIAAHPGLSPSADPGNVFYIDDLALIYNAAGINGARNNLELAVYPNPVSEQLQIESKDSEKLFLNIFDITGKKLLTDEVIDKNTVSVTTLSPGLYFYQVTSSSGNTLKTEKLVKQ